MNLNCLEDLKFSINKLKHKREIKSHENLKLKDNLNFVNDRLETLYQKRKLLLNKLENHEKMMRDTEKMILQSENVYNKIYNNSEKLYYNLKNITNKNN